MRAILAGLVFAVALVGVASPAPAAALAPDNLGPACTDIKGRDGIYLTNSAGNAFFAFSFTILAPACKAATYTLQVADSNGGTITASYPDGGLTLCDSSDSTRFCFTHHYGAASSAPTSVFVTGSSSLGGHTADTTPTVEYVLDGGAGDNSWDQ